MAILNRCSSLSRRFEEAVSRRWVPYFILIGLSFFVGSSIQAMEVRPAFVEMAVDPGGAGTQTIQIRNDEAASQTYRLSLQKFVPQGERGQQTFLPESDVTGVPSWTTFDQASVTLKPNETRTISVSLHVPPEAAPGGYYETVFVASAPTTGSSIPTTFRTGILFFVTVNGTVTKRLQVTDVERLTSKRVSHPPVDIRYTVENQGGIHVAPHGFLYVYNWLNQVVAQIPLNEKGERVLPASRRIFMATWGEGERLDHSSSFWSEVKQEWRAGALGPYRLQLIIDPASVTLPAAIRVWVWPWQLITVVGLGVVVLLALLQIYRRRILRQAMAH